MNEILAGIVTGIFAFFSIILGIEKTRRKNAERKADNAEAKSEVLKVEKVSTEQAIESVNDVVSKVDEVTVHTEQLKEEVKKSENQKDTYNNIVNSFNHPNK